VREKTTLSERKKYPPREKEQPKNLVSSPIGVTSHTTPLPTGEGTGEGPAGDGGGASWGRKKNQLKKREEPAEKERQTSSFRYQETPHKESNKGAKKKLRNLITKRF